MAVPRQLPNTITIVRILMAPVFLWMLLVDGGADGPLRWWAAVLFIVAIATDGIDGWIARRYEIVTDLGKLLDPIADKVLTGFAFIGLSILGELPWWITIVVLIREVGITVHRLVVASDHVVAAAWMGKLKTLAQAVALSLALLPLWTRRRRLDLLGERRHDDDRGAAHGRERHRLRHHRGARGAPRAEHRVTDAEPQATDPSAGSAAEELVSRLIAHGWTVAVAESLTGGLVVSSLVSVPGASATVRGGIVAYATALKHTLLGVDAALLAAQGAVHPDVARQMAEGVRGTAAIDGRAADVGIATTGVAGPDTAGRTPGRHGPHRGLDARRHARGDAGARRHPGADPRRGDRRGPRTRSGVRASDEFVSGGNRPCFVSVTFGDSHPFHSPRD